MKPYAILFSKRDKSKKDHPSMVILVTPEKITFLDYGTNKLMIEDSIKELLDKRIDAVRKRR
mgnify:CR=1 FL=1